MAIYRRSLKVRRRDYMNFVLTLNFRESCQIIALKPVYKIKRYYIWSLKLQPIFGVHALKAN